MITVLTLAMSNFTKSFVVKTNISRINLRVILMQDKHPIAYISRALINRNRLKLVYEKELMAILIII